MLGCLDLLLPGFANAAPVSVTNQPAERETCLPKLIFIDAIRG